MQYLSDIAIDAFFHFYRLGNKSNMPNTALHFALELQLQPHPDGSDIGSIKEVRHTYEVHHRSQKLLGNALSYDTVSSKMKRRHQDPASQDGLRFMNINSSASSSPIRIIVISDTHEREFALNTLPPCDILIHSGDILMTNRLFSNSRSIQKYQAFNEWLGQQPARYKIVIGGNHDKLLEHLRPDELNELFSNGIYLCNSGVEIMGLYIWGCPASIGHSSNRAFQSTEFHQSAHAAIQELHTQQKVVDVLITHGPSEEIEELIKPRLMHVYGHYHELHGLTIEKVRHQRHFSNQLLCVASPIMDRRYDPVNLPIIIDVAVTV